ncbi:MAG: aspartate aminotransferase family protein [Frankia sp.]
MTQDLFLLSRTHMSRRMSGAQKLLGQNAYVSTACGVEVRLNDGRCMVDLGSWATTMVGHRHPGVVSAVIEQLGAFTTAPRGLATSPAPHLAQRLVQLAQPSRLTKVWFGANGADVVEAALKVARVASGRRTVVALKDGFHGRTLGALSVSDADTYISAKQSLTPGVVTIDPGAPPRSAEFWSSVAAVIVEVVQGNGLGTRIPSDQLDEIVTLAHRHGAAVIADEVQTGLWRCGPFSLALELGLDPDIVLLGKALGSGVVPVSAMMATPELFSPLETAPNLHSQTFSGHPLSCAAGLGTLDVLPSLADGHYSRVASWVAGLASGLTDHKSLIARACGLMLTLTFTTSEMTERFVRTATHCGVLVSPCDGNRRAVRLLAPLVVEPQHQEDAENALHLALAAADGPDPR